MATQSLPVILSIATLPSRIGNLRLTLESLMAGDLVPDRILVIVTDFSKREKSGYIIPDFLTDPNYTRGVIEVVVSPTDWGPGTKLLGALSHLPPECHLVLADDDVSYHPDFLSAMVRSQSAEPDRSFSYYTYRVGGLTIGQGCDGFSFYSPNLEGVQEFAEQNVVGTSLMYHDDLWISFFLFRKGVEVKALPTPVMGETVYRQSQPNEGLSSIAFGALARDQIINDNLPRLVRHGKLPKRRRAVLLLNHARDRMAHYWRSFLLQSRRRLAKDNTKLVA